MRGGPSPHGSVEQRACSAERTSGKARAGTSDCMAISASALRVEACIASSAPAPSWRGATSPAKGRKKPAGSLLVSMPADQHERSRIALLDLGEGLRDRRSRRRDCGRRRARCRRPAGASSTSGPDFSRCMRAGQSALTKSRLDCAGVERDAAPPQRRRRRARHSRSGARREASAAAGRAGRRRPGRRAARARRRPCSRAVAEQRRARRLRLELDHRERVLVLRRDDPGTPRFRMPAFSAAMPARSVAEEFRVVVADRGDHRGERRRR